jgi:hypothetical protein
MYIGLGCVAVREKLLVHNDERSRHTRYAGQFLSAFGRSASGLSDLDKSGHRTVCENIDEATGICAYDYKLPFS